MIEVMDLHMRFGANEVLKGINLTVSSGQIAVLIGSSGTGKSTLLRCMNYLEVPTKGTITMDGVTVDSSRISGKSIYEYRRKSAMIFQNFNLFTNMTVLENICLAPMVVQHKEKKDARRDAVQILERIGLSDKKDAYPFQLSGGQQQRVAIGRAMALGSRILLFDEPTSALDPCLVGDVLNLIKELAGEHRTTMVIVTHEMHFARDVADKVLFMNNGRIIEEGSPEQIFENPQKEETRDFLRYYR